MSTAVLTSTSFVGMDIAIMRSPKWETRTQYNVAGHETRVTYRTAARYTWELSFNFLRNSTGYPGYGNGVLDFQNFIGFFNDRFGGYDSFQWFDPDDNSVTNQTLTNNGDGTGLNYPLSRSFGGFSEPVLAPIITSSTSVIITETDWRGTYTLSTANRNNNISNSQNISTQALFTASTAGTSTMWLANPTSTYFTYSTGRVAPDGTLTATLVVTTSSAAGGQVGFVGNDSELAPNTEISSTQTWTLSGYFASNGNSTCFVVLWAEGSSNADTALATFDLVNGVVGIKHDGNGGTVTAFSISTLLTGGWYRCQLQFHVADLASYFLEVGACSTANSFTTPPPAGCQYFIWGLQLEQSTFATPLIPTSSVGYGSSVPDYSLTAWGLSSSPGLVQLSNVPASSAIFQVASLSYYWPVRFDEDKIVFNRTAQNLWELKKISFTSII